MRAYGILAHPENGMRHDAGVILDSFDEFNAVIPHLVQHLRVKRQKADPVLAEAISKRQEGLEAVHEQLLTGNIDDGTLEIRLTPMESEAVAQRLAGSAGVVSDVELALGGMIGCQLAQQYHRQYGIMPDNLIPMMRASSETVDVSAL